MAAAYALQGVLGWKGKVQSVRFRSVGAIILLLGTLFSMLGYKPLELIQLAQVANGLLLPVIAAFLWVMVNRTSLMGKYRNTLWQNVLAALVMGIVLLLTYRTALLLWEKWM
ncbi:MAG: divalent metal cation transporter [Salibacteraceae bacterium]